MNFKKLSLRIRIFLSMILLILLTYVLIALVTIYQFNEQTINYNTQRFERKETATRLSIQYEMDKVQTALATEQIFGFFSKPILEIVKIHSLNINFYDLQGKLLLSSEAVSEGNTMEGSSQTLKPYELKKLLSEGQFAEGKALDDGKVLKSKCSYLYNKVGLQVAFLKIYYVQDNSIQDRDLKDFLERLAVVYLFMFVIAISFAYFLSSYITKSLNTIIDKIGNIGKTGLHGDKDKIEMGATSREIFKLVSAYNNMIDQIEEASKKLAASEREEAWREMAKQVAHEIKNPLTPMRLTVQSFERRFDPNDPNIKESLKEYSKSIIQQIDIMSSIATAFSDFAKMPKQRKENIEVISVIKIALDIFENENITFTTNIEEVNLSVDKSQLIRILTNLVKNAIQATESKESPKIDISIINTAKNFEIKVKDNGEGIDEELKNLIFEPRFTTKNSGMGLGLAMTKKIIETYKGEISFVSTIDQGTVFSVIIPKE